MAKLPAAAPLLERALILTFLLHGLGMLAMAALLLPTMPGGPTLVTADRIALIAQQPWRFRLGWLPWQLTAASDLLLGVALVRTAWISRPLAWLVVVLTVAAVIPDQLAQARWITQGIELAQAAVRSGDPTLYLAFEAVIFPMTGVWAALLYTLAALGWTACFVRAGVWSRILTSLSALTWGIFGIVTIGPLLPAPLTLPGRAIAVGNACGFVCMMSWFALVSEQVLRHTRPVDRHGRWAVWSAPWPGLWGRVLELVANSRFIRRLCALLPVFDFGSDITEVVYVNYLVPAAALLPLLPPGLTLQRLGPDERWAMFTFLTYQHGHFGPVILGPLRRLFGSPVQSNWRIYVRDDRTSLSGIYFVTNAVTTQLHALGARLMAEGMPMHLLRHGEVLRAGDGSVRVILDPGQGSAPDAQLELRPTADRSLSGPWAECFPDYATLLRYTVPQDRAMSTLPTEAVTVRQEIDLAVPLDTCEPLTCAVSSRAAAAIVGQATALCFRIPRVHLLFTGEKHDRWSAT